METKNKKTLKRELKREDKQFRLLARREFRRRGIAHKQIDKKGREIVYQC